MPDGKTSCLANIPARIRTELQNDLLCIAVNIAWEALICLEPTNTLHTKRLWKRRQNA